MGAWLPTHTAVHPLTSEDISDVVTRAYKLTMTMKAPTDAVNRFQPEPCLDARGFPLIFKKNTCYESK